MLTYGPRNGSNVMPNSVLETGLRGGAYLATNGDVVLPPGGDIYRTIPKVYRDTMRGILSVTGKIYTEGLDEYESIDPNGPDAGWRFRLQLIGSTRYEYQVYPDPGYYLQASDNIKYASWRLNADIPMPDDTITSGTITLQPCATKTLTYRLEGFGMWVSPRNTEASAASLAERSVDTPRSISAPTLLCDYNTHLLNISQKETQVSSITYSVDTFADLQGTLSIAYTANNDCAITVRVKDNGAEELYAPIVYDVKAGHGCISFPHVYVSRSPGVHTCAVTLQSTSPILINTRGITHSITGYGMCESTPVDLPEAPAAPTLSVVESGATLHFRIEGKQYTCYRVVMHHGDFADEFITYEPELIVDKPKTGTYSCYCMGYNELDCVVSQNSNTLSVVVKEA